MWSPLYENETGKKSFIGFYSMLHLLAAGQEDFLSLVAPIYLLYCQPENMKELAYLTFPNKRYKRNVHKCQQNAHIDCLHSLPITRAAVLLCLLKIAASL